MRDDNVCLTGGVGIACHRENLGPMIARADVRGERVAGQERLDGESGKDPCAPSIAAVMYRARPGLSKTPSNNPRSPKRYDIAVRMTMTGSRQAQFAVMRDGSGFGRR